MTLKRTFRRRLLRLLRATRLYQPARTHVLLPLRAARATVRPRRTAEERAIAELTAELRPLTSFHGRVIVGPWLSEVGFELLYWIPFLRWLTERFEIPPERLTALSRGGVAHWYEGICGAYVDVFDVIPAEEFRRHGVRRWRSEGGQKQFDRGRWDRHVLRRARERLPDRAHVLHPSLMYWFFAPYWRGEAPLAHVTEHARFTPLAPAPVGEDHDARLPSAEYVAAKFYFRPSLPHDERNRQAVRELMAGLSQEYDVVLLNTGLSLDDHVDAEFDSEARLTRPIVGVSPERNLLSQDVAISGAQAFHGTYGGLSYLAAMRGIPSIAYYSHRQHFVPRHLDVAREATSGVGGELDLVDVRTIAVP